MYNPLKHMDTVTSLINQLRVISDDMCFLQRTNQPFNLDDYPNIIATANKTLLDPSGNWAVSNVERVEKAGFDVFKTEQGIAVYTLYGIIPIPTLLSVYHYHSLDWRDTLI
jgi:hypothetical protein